MITLVLGGTRSGKSEVAEQLAVRAPQPVVYVATAQCAPDDTDFARRIATHRARRSPVWTTVEESRDLAGVLLQYDATALVDSLGTWLSNFDGFAADVDALCEALVRRRADTIVVSEEVGLAVHPPTDAGRRFTDALGACNHAVARIADRAVLVVAGRVLELGAL